MYEDEVCIFVYEFNVEPIEMPRVIYQRMVY